MVSGGFARVVRASVLTIKDQDFIEAARFYGANDMRIIAKYILPNCLTPIIVQATLSVANAILMIASLSFMGLGIQPPMPRKETGFVVGYELAALRLWYLQQLFYHGLPQVSQYLWKILPD